MRSELTSRAGPLEVDGLGELRVRERLGNRGGGLAHISRALGRRLRVAAQRQDQRLQPEREEALLLCLRALGPAQRERERRVARRRRRVEVADPKREQSALQLECATRGRAE